MNNYQELVDFFEEKDKKIGQLLKDQGPKVAKIERDTFKSLVHAIIGQQLSVKAAATIFQRFQDYFNGVLDPKLIAQSTQEELRSIGISKQKYSYLVDLSEHFLEYPEVFEKLPELSDQEIIDQLTKIKGIGVWTTQMFLMFTLGRENVFPVDDLGIRNAMNAIYNWKGKIPKEKYIRKAKKWHPHESIACYYLWGSLH